MTQKLLDRIKALEAMNDQQAQLITALKRKLAKAGQAVEHHKTRTDARREGESVSKINEAEWTERIKQICADACAYPYGEPPCWRLPDLTDYCEEITPCDNCLAIMAEEDAKP
jgi:hypothetical protein